MNPLIRILVIVVFLGILVSLGSALFHLSRGGTARTSEDSKKMVRALTVRVGLSIALFLFLMIAWHAGLVTPHAIESTRPVTTSP
jgi:hypothetical protein